MVSAISDSFLASLGVPPLEISENNGRINMISLPDIMSHREAQNLKRILTGLIWSVDYGSSKSKTAQIASFLEKQLLDMVIQ